MVNTVLGVVSTVRGMVSTVRTGFICPTCGLYGSCVDCVDAIAPCDPRRTLSALAPSHAYIYHLSDVRWTHVAARRLASYGALCGCNGLYVVGKGRVWLIGPIGPIGD